MNPSKAVWYSGYIFRSPNLNGSSTDKSWKGVDQTFVFVVLYAKCSLTDEKVTKAPMDTMRTS